MNQSNNETNTPRYVPARKANHPIFEMDITCECYSTRKTAYSPRKMEEEDIVMAFCTECKRETQHMVMCVNEMSVIE